MEGISFVSMISRKAMLEQMRLKDEHGRFVPFSIRFVTYDENKKDGGELVDYANVTLPQREQVELETISKMDRSKGPFHKKTTVTFRTPGEEFRSCHIHLITRFNGQHVF